MDRSGRAVVNCLYCREQLAEDATVCPHCRAYAVETSTSVDWYRAGDSRTRHVVLRWVLPMALAVAVVVGGFIVSDNAHRKAKNDATECVDEIARGREC